MNLETLQREMAAAIMQPLTADETMCPIAPDGRKMHAIAKSFIAPNSQLSAFERLEIYNRQYWFRVLSALIEDFPALRAVVGGNRFDAISVAYLTAHPSRSFTLRNLGSKLPEWLAANPALAGRRHRLAVDVARIEWAFVESFDNAEGTPLTPDQVATLDGDSRLTLQPHLQLMALDYAADNLVLSLHDRQKREASEAGHKHDEIQPAPVKLPKLRRKPTWLASHRVDLRVYYRRLEREEFQTLMAIRSGLPLGEALEAGFLGSSLNAARKPQKLRQWFANWAELGWLCPPNLESIITT
jgi:hypothetical protein